MTTVRINDPGKQIPFGSLEIGAVFLSPRYYAIKIDTISHPHWFAEVNAIDLKTGVRLTFLDTALVTLVKEVVINV